MSVLFCMDTRKGLFTSCNFDASRIGWHNAPAVAIAAACSPDARERSPRGTRSDWVVARLPIDRDARVTSVERAASADDGCVDGEERSHDGAGGDNGEGAEVLAELHVGELTIVCCGVVGGCALVRGGPLG